MPDPAEGIGPDGYLITGAAPSNLRPPFHAPLEAAAGECGSACSGRYGLYVYGSVATGQAVEAVSDLDLLLVVDQPGDLEAVPDVAQALSRRFRDVVREVSLATATENEIFGDTPEGHAFRCFVKHYCVCVSGTDLSTGLPRCRPSGQLARGFAADTADVLARVRAELQDADAAEVCRLAQSAARKLLLTCAAIVSVETGTWTTNRERAADELARLHPEHAASLTRAAEWSNPAGAPDADPREVKQFVDVFGT